MFSPAASHVKSFLTIFQQHSANHHKKFKSKSSSLILRSSHLSRGNDVESDSKVGVQDAGVCGGRYRSELQVAEEQRHEEEHVEAHGAVDDVPVRQLHMHVLPRLPHVAPC